MTIEAAQSDLAKLTVWVRRRIDDGVSKTVKLSVADVGVIRVEGAKVSNEDGPADLTLSISAQTLHDLWNDKIHPLKNMPSGAVKVSDKLLALRMAPRLVKLLATKPV